jgi:large subunit ribosomal protein L3
MRRIFSDLESGCFSKLNSLGVACRVFIFFLLRSKGHGFTGAMKRWNFRGQPASHGVSLAHRSLGATGSRQDPGKVFKGKRMAGRMGHENVTVQNLRVHKLDTWNELIFLVGAVPGVVGSYVKMTDAVKQPQSARKAPFPTYVHHKGDLRHQWIIEGPPKKDPFAVPHHVVPL